MRHAVEPRQALGVRTVFNVLGPLTNPAGAPHQVMGVYDEAWLEPLAEVMRQLGNGRSILVHGRDGLDELTVTTSSHVVLVDGDITRLSVDSRDLGLGRYEMEQLAGGGAEENAAIIRSVLAGQGGAARDIVVLNAAAALWTCGKVGDLRDGCEAASRAIDEGRARETLEAYVEFSRERGERT
jgi:anthranilate phosphoribosyltransferase